jgi:hypothetical protein
MPILIVLAGLGTLETYHVIVLKGQLNLTTQTIDQMDSQFKKAQYEKTKFYHVARGVLRLASKDPTAEQIVIHYKLRELQNAQPELMASGPPSDFAASTNAPPVHSGDATNAVPAQPSPATNAAPNQSPAPTAK